jgi:hypothetical protein
MRKRLFQKKRLRKKHTLPIICIVIGVVFGTFFVLEQKRPTNAQSSDIKAAGPYVDVNWPGENYTSREWEFTPLSESPEGYFWAYQQGFVNGDGFYVGMQHPTEGKKKLVLFSVWQALSGAPIDQANGSWCQTFAGEGDGYSCRINYEWVQGRTYTFRVEQIAPSWWGAWIKDTVTEKEEAIGKIHVPESWGGLQRTSIIWTEYFGGAKMQSCNDIPYAKGRWDKIVSDNTIKPSSYNPHIANTACKANAKIVQERNGFVEEMGLAAKDRGLNATYFSAPNFTGTQVKQVDETINFPSFAKGSPAKGIDPRSFSVRWEGNIVIPKSGAYSFILLGNGIARLWINDQVLANGKLLDTSVQTEQISLQKGKIYPIKLEYASAASDAKLTLGWSGPGIAKTRIPQYYFVANNTSLPSSSAEVGIGEEKPKESSGPLSFLARLFNCTENSVSSICSWLLR